MTLAECIGPAVQRRRLLLGMTQAQLAKLVQTHRPLVARVESGRHTVTIETLERYADALQVRSSVLLAEAEKWLELECACTYPDEVAV